MKMKAQRESERENDLMSAGCTMLMVVVLVLVVDGEDDRAVR